MKYVVPQEIEILDTNVPLNDYPEYNNSTTYNAGDKVTVADDKKNYYCTVDNTQNKIPKDNPNLWVSSPMNRYALLDGTFGTQTKNQDSIDISFNAKNCDSICFFNLDANSISIKMTDNTTNTIVYNEDFSLSYDELSGFGDYLFNEKELRDRLVDKVSISTLEAVINSMTEQQILDRFTANPPIYYDTKVEISIKKQGGMAKCGFLCVGRQRDLGLSLWDGVKTGIQSFSRKERNPQWGTVELKKGEIADLMSLNCLLDTANVDVVRNRLKKIDGIPCVFLGDESNNINSLTIYGFFKDFIMPLNPTKTVYTLEIESLI